MSFPAFDTKFGTFKDNGFRPLISKNCVSGRELSKRVRAVCRVSGFFVAPRRACANSMRSARVASGDIIPFRVAMTFGGSRP